MPDFILMAIDEPCLKLVKTPKKTQSRIMVEAHSGGFDEKNFLWALMIIEGFCQKVAVNHRKNSPEIWARQISEDFLKNLILENLQQFFRAN